MLYFAGIEENMESVNSLYDMADGTMKAIGHLFAASICNYSPASRFFINTDIQLHCWQHWSSFRYFTSYFRYQIFRLPICSVQQGMLNVSVIKCQVGLWIWLFYYGGPCYIETSPLICCANQWAGFYMMGTPS